MVKTYYDNSDEGQRLQPGTTAEAAVVDGKFDQVQVGLEDVEKDTRRSVKIPFEDGMESQEVVATLLQRRTKVLGFDQDGNLALRDGFTWRGDWAPGTDYFINDVVRDPGTKNLYIAQERMTSGSAFDALKWSLGVNVVDVESAKDSAIAARDTALAARDTTTAARDTTLEARDTTIDVRDDALTRLKGAEYDMSLGDYAAGIEVTAYNQLLRDTSGEFWRASGSTSLPYTTTGAGLPEGGAFVFVGEAALRKDLVQPVATFNSVADMVANGGLSVGRKARTLGYYTPGDGGGNDYEIVAAATGTADGGSFIDLDNGLQARGLFPAEVWVEQFGARDGEDSTAGIQAAHDYVASLGGGALNFGKGEFLVDYDDSQGAPYSAVFWNQDNMHWRGQGIGATRIRAENNEGRYSVVRIIEDPLENGITKVVHGSICNILLDGNYAGTTPVRDVSVINCAGLGDFCFKDLKIVKSAQYGIGLQNGGYQDCRIINVEIDTTCADGIDVKDNGSISRGCSIDNLVVRNFGRKTNTEFPYAGVDLLARGWRLSNIYVTDYGASGSQEAAIRFKQGGELVARGYSPEWSSLTNFVIEQTSYTTVTYGIYCKAPYVAISNGTINGATHDGIKLEQPYCVLSNIVSKGAKVGNDSHGFVFSTKSSTDSEFDGADFCNAINCVAINYENGFVLVRKNTLISDCRAIDCDVGIELVGSNSVSNQVMNSTVTNCTTPLVTNDNSAHMFFGNKGFSAPTVETPTSGGASDILRISSPTQSDMVTGYDGTVGSGVTALRVDDDASDKVLTFVGGSLKRLEVGAEDSAGTGYRAVRVSN